MTQISNEIKQKIEAEALKRYPDEIYGISFRSSIRKIFIEGAEHALSLASQGWVSEFPEILKGNFDEMVRCKHSYELNEGGSGSGPNFDYERNICVCRKCGEIKISGKENGTRYSQEFSINYPDSVKAILRFALSMHPEHFEDIFPPLPPSPNQSIQSQEK
jgi:hypothetical protein